MRAIDTIHPGEQLREEFMKRLGITAEKLAADIGVPVGQVVAVVEEQAPVSSEMALRLARYFGTTPRFWLDMQRDHDLERTAAELGDRLDHEVKAGAAGLPYGGPDRRARLRLA
jgi:addiction module HigA family antidote